MALKTIKKAFIDLVAESQKKSSIDRYHDACEKWRSKTETLEPYKNYDSFKSARTKKK